MIRIPFRSTGCSTVSERNPAASEDALKKCPGLSFVIDGTEREIQRPKDPEEQIIFYSGKKKDAYGEKHCHRRCSQ
jgi:hypothetical protein